MATQLPLPAPSLPTCNFPSLGLPNPPNLLAALLKFFPSLPSFPNIPLPKPPVCPFH